MCRIFRIHPDNPQPRLVSHVVELLLAGEVIAYPTDSTYALCCQLSDKRAFDQILRIRILKKNHHFTLVCPDLSKLANYANVDNATYRFLKAHTPGPYTFILNASREVPKRLQNPKRKTVGLRIPDNNIVMAILKELDQPIMSVSLKLPGDELPLTDPDDIAQRLESQIAAVVDGGILGFEETTVVDLTAEPKILREGLGVVELL